MNESQREVTYEQDMFADPAGQVPPVEVRQLRRPHETERRWYYITPRGHAIGPYDNRRQAGLFGIELSDG